MTVLPSDSLVVKSPRAALSPLIGRSDPVGLCTVRAEHIRHRHVGQQGAIPYDGNPIADLLGHVETVGCQEHCLALLGRKAWNPSPHGAGSLYVETQHRLIQNQDRWIIDEGAGDRDFLLHPSRQQLDELVSSIRQTKLSQEPLCPLSPISTGAFQSRKVGQILPN